MFGRVKVASWAFIFEEFMEISEAFAAEVNTVNQLLAKVCARSTG